MNLSDIKHLFNYTEWANQLAMDAAAKLPDEHLRRDVGISHKSIFGTLLHMAGAEWIWLERWNGRSPAKAEAWSQWTTETCADLATLTERWRNVIDARTQFISGLARRATRSGISIQTAQRRSKLDASRRSNAAHRESLNDAPRASSRNDSPTRHRPTGYGSYLLYPPRDISPK